jgi:hypothetical protein
VSGERLAEGTPAVPPDASFRTGLHFGPHRATTLQEPAMRIQSNHPSSSALHASSAAKTRAEAAKAKGTSVAETFTAGKGPTASAAPAKASVISTAATVAAPAAPAETVKTASAAEAAAAAESPAHYAGAGSLLDAHA